MACSHASSWSGHQRNLNDGTVSAQTMSWTGEVLSVLKRLHDLDFEPGKDGDPEPVDLYLEPAASGLWGDFVNQHGERVVEIASEDLRAAYAKLEGATARLALIFHLVAWAASIRPTPGPIDRVALGTGHQHDRLVQA